MLGVVGRAWSVWREKARLVAPVWTRKTGVVFAHKLLFPELQSVLRADGPLLQPYQGLAGIWNEYGPAHMFDYPPYLSALARRRGIALGSVLDLACGTGVLTARLTHVAGDVVGLDASEDMLAEARRRHADQTGTRFVRGDFRDFALDRQFDAAVCASNSLNYVADRDELRRVFTAVGKHLRPGGVFVFDTSSSRGMQRVSGLFLHVERGNRRFALTFSYDAKQRKENSRAILPFGVERHPRIPLDPADVEAAVAGSGLDVADYFSSAILPRNWGHGWFYIFVLTKRA